MPDQSQNQNHPLRGLWSILDQNLTGGMMPGGAPPFYQQAVNQFNQGREISRGNDGGGLRQTGRGLVNVVDGNLLGGLLPGGVTPREVFTGQPNQGQGGKNPQGNSTAPTQPAQSNGGIYNRMDSMLGNRLPGGNQPQGKNPSPQTGMGVNFPTMNGMPLPVQLQNPRATGMPNQNPPQHTQDQSQQPNKNPNMGAGQAPITNRPGYMQSQYDALNPITTSGGAFNNAVSHYGSLQRPNRNQAQ